MEIVNIIVCSLNSVDSVKSFVVVDQANRQAVVEQAEKEFERIAIEIGWDEDDHINIEDLLDQGYFSNGNDKTVCISWSDNVTLTGSFSDKRPTVEGTKGAYLTELKEVLKSLNHCLPIDLEKINRDFGIENGGILKRLNEGDVDYILKDFEEFSTEYENLEVTDLEEILSILDEIKAVDEKTQNSTKNENF